MDVVGAVTDKPEYIPARGEDWIPYSKPARVKPSLGQAFQVYRDVLDRIVKNQREWGFPEETAPKRARKLAREILKVPASFIQEAINAASEADLQSLKTFKPPVRLKVEDLGLETDPKFMARLARTHALLYSARFGPQSTLRKLTDLLAFNLPCDPILVQEAIQQCDELVNTLTKLFPIALCPGCLGLGHSEASGSSMTSGCPCGGSGYIACTTPANWAPMVAGAGHEETEDEVLGADASLDRVGEPEDAEDRG